MKFFGKESIETRPLSDLEANHRSDRYNSQDAMFHSLSLQFPGMSLDTQMETKQSTAMDVYDQQPAMTQEVATQEMVGGSHEFVQAA